MSVTVASFDSDALRDVIISLPEDQKALRTEISNLRGLSKYFRQMRIDLTRQEQYETTKVYCLDFSEIAAYLYPRHKRYRGEMTYAKAAQFVLERGKEVVTLPPGTLTELLQHLESLENELRRTEVPTGGLLDFIESEEVGRFRETVANFRGLKNATQDAKRAMLGFGKAFPVAARLDRLKKSYPHVAHALGRLKWLIEHRTTSFSDFVCAKRVDIDDFEFEEALFRLSKKRPLFSLSNRLDALNFAFVHFLNNEFSRDRRLYFNLITRGAALEAFRTQEWEDDPIKETEDFEHVPLVRDIVFAAYESLVDLKFPSLDMRIDFVSSLSKHANARMNMSQTKIAALKAGQQSFSFEDFERRSGATLYGLASAQFAHRGDFDSFVSAGQDLFESDSDLEAKVLSVKDILTPEACRILINQRVELASQLAAVRRAAEQRLEEVGRIVAEHLPSYRVPSAKPLWEFDVEVSGERRDCTDVETRLVVARTTRKVICEIDLHPTFFVVNTKTWSGRFEKFLRLASYLVAQASSRDALMGMRRIEKAFDGIFVLTTAGSSWNSGPLEDIRFPPDPDWVWLQSTRAGHGLPRLIRVNSPFMDLFYEQQIAVGPSLTGRSGIISHVALPDLIAHFVARCQDTLVRVDSLEDVLARLLETKYPL